MKIAIVGGRDFNDYELLCMWACTIDEFSPMPHTIVSGGAKGADTLGAKFADDNKLSKEIFLPNWKELGKSAGFIRNQQIVDACDIVLAFWDGKSKGTKDTINRARIAKKPTILVYYQS